jgi:hypothetical protein
MLSPLKSGNRDAPLYLLSAYFPDVLFFLSPANNPPDE